MTKTNQKDPWAGGLFGCTKAAQKAFGNQTFSDEQVEWSKEYHHNVATADDRARVEALEGDEDQIIAWYWNYSYSAS